MSSASLPGLTSHYRLRAVQVPTALRGLSWLLFGLLMTTIVGLIVTPWQQNIRGTGRVIAFAPEERPQDVQAAVDGRIVKWHVVEGSLVKKGQPLVDLSDNDAEIMERLQQERDATLRTESAGMQRIRTIEDRIRALERQQKTAIAAASARVQMGKDRVQAAEQALSAARAALVAATQRRDRQKNLMAKGLTATQTVELAEMDYAQKVADVDRAVATLNAAKNEAISLASELERTDADAASRIEEAWGVHASALSDVAKARVEITKVDNRLARQSQQRVLAPVDGVVFRVVARQSGELMKAGQTLATIVPRTTKDVVELFVDGNDVPLISPGRDVRLQFEGWPAIQFAGWPSVAVGTFGGKVQLVDSTDNGQGKFRVLVEQDPNEEPWPSKQYLRQGVRAEGWVLLNQVPIWYELWRQFNGFPPVVSTAEPDDKKESKEKK